MRSGGRHFLGVVGGCALLCGAGRMRAASAPQLGSATSFAILGGSAVTSQGPTTVIGNVGVSPGKTIDGLGADAVAVGALYRNDTVARQAQRDAAAASAELTHVACVALAAFPSTLTPGVYCVAPFAMPLSGTLTLDAAGDAEGVWIFRVSELTTAVGASVVVANGGHDRNVFWQVASTVTLGERTAFAGNILAAAITLQNGATLSGRALARTGAVLLDSNKVSLCCEPIEILQAGLPPAFVGVPYQQQLTANGGTGVYTFAATGPLPAGLTLTAGGTIAGTPLTKGSFAFSVTATDTHGCSGTRVYTIEVACVTTIVVSPAVLPGGTVGTPYFAVIRATGTSSATFPPPTNLPPGLSLITVAGRGLLSGPPTLAGQFTFDLTAEDTISHCAGSTTYTVTICPRIVTFPTLPDGFIGVPYSEVVLASGGAAPYRFDLVSGSLPSDLVPFADGTVSGTPTVDGTSIVTFRVTDANGCTGEGDVTIVIRPAPLIGPDIDALSGWGIALLCGALALAGFRRSLG
jgi:hypothetical protein